MQRRIFRLPKAKVSNPQTFLWEQPIGNHGHVRTTLGDFAEDLTALLFHGTRLRTDSRADYCPDIFVEDGIYLECKTSGLSRQTFVYEGRLNKDREFAASHHLLYVVWCHSLATNESKTIEELKRQFLLSINCIYLIPFSEIDRIALENAPVKLNSHYGHSDTNPVYGSGYRIPISKFASCIHQKIEWSTAWTLSPQSSGHGQRLKKASTKNA
jgi:hypothetical protein